jgi:hypothetical protein
MSCPSCLQDFFRMIKQPCCIFACVACFVHKSLQDLLQHDEAFSFPVFLSAFKQHSPNLFGLVA